MTDLTTRAAALLTAVDKMTPGEWVYSPERSTHDSCIHTKDAVLSDRGWGKNYIAPEDGCVVGSSEWIWIEDHDGYGIAVLHNEAPALIRELLAENERLGKAMRVQSNAVRNLRSAEASLAAADREAAEKARKMTDSKALNGILDANDKLTNEVELLEKQRDILNKSVAQMTADNERLRARVAELEAPTPIDETKDAGPSPFQGRTTRRDEDDDKEYNFMMSHYEGRN